ncbi:MAG: hypothetical protein P8N43_03205, partial [Alphaproteobacteria bacterium]|nr:hypothetical protein [Alphaproteobacteria bacterium]
EACANAGVPMVSILADGFSEAGLEGEARQTSLTEIANQSSTRILGPNSMGMVNCAEGIGLTVNAALDIESLVPGRLMGISQSGSIVGTLISRGEARGIGFSSIVSVGNEADLTVGDIGLAAVDDPGVDAFVLFMETIRRPAALAGFAAAARQAGKPVIVYKLGRSEMVRELAVSHTGALVGSDVASDAFFRAHGIVRVDQFETLIEASPLLMTEAVGKEIRRDKPVAVITTTGGGGAMVVDRLGAFGIKVAAGSEQLRAGLREKGIDLGAGKLTDVTLAGAHYEAMLAVLDAFVSSGEFSVVVSTVGSSAQFRPKTRCSRSSMSTRAWPPWRRSWCRKPTRRCARSPPLGSLGSGPRKVAPRRSEPCWSVTTPARSPCPQPLNCRVDCYRGRKTKAFHLRSCEGWGSKPLKPRSFKQVSRFQLG